MQRRYFSTLGGDKIGSWGRNSPVGALKEKPPYDQSTSKNHVASENLRVFGKRTALRSSRRSRRDHQALRYTASILAGNPTACWFASFVTFLSNKEKLDRSPFTKGKEPSLVGRQRKTFFYSLRENLSLFPIRNLKKT